MSRNRENRLRAVFVVLLIFAFVLARAQETVVIGKVTDAGSGDPIPFVNIFFKGTNIGTRTDFDGHFKLSTKALSDSLTASYVGYKVKTKGVVNGTSQVINIQLEEAVQNLQEVSVFAGENPAFEILRQVIKHKGHNDKASLSAYEYDTYTKIEIDLDNFSKSMRDRKTVQKITQVIDSMETIAGADGQPVVPIFITESVSKVYFRSNPTLKKEFIEKSKINGIGIEDGALISQLIGSSFQEYNFYSNWLNIVTKDFVSPIADGWRFHYEYDLTDSLYIGDEFCYRLDFFPKSKQDLAFSGTMWIAKKDFGIKQIDASIGKEANLNFVEKIRIQQELERTEGGAWIPTKNRVLVDIGELTRNSTGLLGKFYTSNKNFVINHPRSKRFYEQPIELAEDARLFNDEKYWDTIRHEPLTQSEKNVYRMIDTLRNIPEIKAYTELIKAMVDGYLDVGKGFELGPYIGMVVANNIEGIRVQGGIKTNSKFSKNWMYRATVAYGFKDTRVKFSVGATHILSRDHWTTATFRIRSDIARVGVDEQTLPNNPAFVELTRWGTLRRGYYFNESYASIQREFFRGFQQKVSFRSWSFDPTFNFGYLADPTDAGSVTENFNSSEITLETRYGRDETWLQNGNERVSMGTRKWPLFIFQYTRGIKGVLGSNFNYDKINFTISKRMKTGLLGEAYMTLNGGYVFNALPYPLLSLHLGNQTPVYSTVTYNLMNYGEFVSDHYVSLRYRQYLEGFLLNRIPLIQKLNWRLLGTANILQGGLRTANRNLIAPYTVDGNPTLPVGYLGSKPYVELGYGVENIFRFLRLDFVHRVTYTDVPNARKFGVLFTMQFQL